jgi:hypothetical protein
MNFSTRTIATLATAVAFSATSANAFATVGRSVRPRLDTRGPQRLTRAETKRGAGYPSIAALLAVKSPSEADQDVKRLQAMAAQLREEATELERKQGWERSQAAGRAFDKFDTNQDGELSLYELKVALEKTFKLDVPEDQVQRLMDDFDTSGDGKLQKDEFVGIERFRNRLDSIVYDERQRKVESQKLAQKEAEIAQLIESQLDLINDKEPSNTDRIVSALPYLLPLMDGLSFGQFLLTGHESNPFVGVLALLFTVYRSIPLSGFVAFFALSSLSSNLSTNRLVRFNAQQALYLDFALFVPGLVMALAGAASSGLGLSIPPVIGELSSDAVFVTLIAALGYSAVSSLLGVTPDKIPFLSESVNKRVPTVDMIQFIDPATGEPFFKSSDKSTVEDDDETNDM